MSQVAQSQEALPVKLNTSPVERVRGLNKYYLLESLNEDVYNNYERFFKDLEDVLSQVLDNDSLSKIIVGISDLNPTKDQAQTLCLIGAAFKKVDMKIDPDRLQFEVSKTPDDEICIYKNTALGLSNLIVNEDGTFAYSFIPNKDVNKKDIFEFYDTNKVNDLEQIAYQFFTY